MITLRMKHLVCTLLAIIILYVQRGSSTVSNSEGSNTVPLSRYRRGGLSMLRLGRGLHMLRLGKRSLSMLRLGRRSSPEAPSPSDLDFLLYGLLRKLKYGKALEDRQVPVPRYGRQEEGEDMDDDVMPYGYEPVRGPPSGLNRFRRSADSDEEMKNDDQDNERAVPAPRLGRDEFASNWNADYGYGNGEYEAAKRSLSMLRLGKRRLNMLRLGKREFEEKQEAEKRMLNMLRLGKREAPNSDLTEHENSISS